MEVVVILLSISILFGSTAGGSKDRAEDSIKHDLVEFLPHLDGPIEFGLYSGYLRASKARKFHYMFVESKNDPLKDPLLLWLNGGPGCSSLEGFFVENGPFRVTEGGDGLEKNPYSWNKVASILYLESPQGVGFSYNDSREPFSTDDETSLDNLLALKNFFERFPKFRSNPLYLTGFSYAGVYVPTLSVRLLSERDINYKGFAVGNGYFDRTKIHESIIDFAYFHGIVDGSQFSKLKKTCCRNSTLSNHGKLCEIIKDTRVNEMCLRFVFKGFRNKADSEGVRPSHVINKCEERINRRLADPWVRAFESKSLAPCIDGKDLEVYLDKKTVREALHIPQHLRRWQSCNAAIESNHEQQYRTVKKEVLKTLEAGKRVMIYNGDLDMICDLVGVQIFVEDLNLEPISEYYPWHHSGQVAGFVRYFKGGLSSVTIRGAGHDAIKDRPPQGLKMIKKFLRDEKLD